MAANVLPRRFARRPWALLSVLFVIAGMAGALVLWANSKAAVLSVEQVASAAEYNRRKDRYIDSLLTSTSTSWPGLDATRGMALIDRAVRTGDMSRIAEANSYIYNDVGKVDPTSWEGSLSHGAPLPLISAYLRYKDRPDLLYPSTRDRIKTGKLKNGTVDRNKSLIPYKEKIFNKYTTDKMNFDIATFNPWDPTGPGGYNGTENHKLQTITSAMLLTEVYAGETYRGYPVKDNTSARDDFWHYFRDAFFRYSGVWTSNGSPNDHFGGDVVGLEKDAQQYTRAYVEDYWLIRDFFSDPVVKKHAEIFLDRTLIDMAEDTVMGMYTGPGGRHYTLSETNGHTMHIHVINYLLFDNLGFDFPLNHGYRWGFGAWGYGAMLTSDYNPTHPDFPKAIIDLARNKEGGYLVTNGRMRHANWVEDKIALGFPVNGRIYGEGHAGGFFVYNKFSHGPGLNIVSYYGNIPFDKKRPQQVFNGIVDRRTALIRDYNGGNQLKIWIQNGFDSVDMTSTWMFFREPMAGGGEAYLAIRPSVGGHSEGAAITTANMKGRVRVINTKEAPLIWEMSTSNEHSSFAAFKADIQDNALTVTSSRVTYTSSKNGVTLSYDRANNQAHQVNGKTVSWSDYDHGFKTPWSSNKYGSHKAEVNKGGYSVQYDWSPTSGGSFDKMPTKTVKNNAVPLPDLVVTDIAWSPSNPKPGDAVTFSATIKNQGAGPTSGGVKHGIIFRVNDSNSTWSDTFFGPLAPGESKTLTANGGTNGSSWAAQQGTFSVSAHVDNDNQTTETNEDNNKMTKELVVGAASTTRPGDINNDGMINATDLTIVLTNYGRTSATKSSGDVNGDGMVNSLDLSIILTDYGM